MRAPSGKAGPGASGRRGLQQNEPNPFHEETVIRYRVEAAGAVRLCVYDLLGRHVCTIVDAVQPPDVYAVTFDGCALPRGVYLYRLETEAGTQTRQMVLVH